MAWKTAEIQTTKCSFLFPFCYIFMPELLKKIYILAKTDKFLHYIHIKFTIKTIGKLAKKESKGRRHCMVFRLF